MPDAIFRLVEEALNEVESEKQRRWACAQKDKPASERPEDLSEKEAEEMCRSKVDEISSVAGGAAEGGIGGPPRRRRLEPGWEELEEDEIDPPPAKRRKRPVIMKEKDLTEAVYEFLTNSGTI
jgi:hypothetical protein